MNKGIGFSSNAGQTFETLSKEISNPVSGITALQILRFLKEVKSISSPENKNRKFFEKFSQRTGRFAGE